MNKQEFLSALREGLAGLPQADIEERLSFYDEMIDDRMEEGLSEQEALAELGSVEEVIAQIAAETPLKKLVKERVRKERQRSGKGWTTALLIIGSPVWASLLIAAIAVVFSVYVSVWAVVISLYAAALSLAAGGVGGVLFTIRYVLAGNMPGAAFIGGAGMVCIGLGILLFFGCNRLAKGVARMTKKMILGWKSLLVRKGNGQ